MISHDYTKRHFGHDFFIKAIIENGIHIELGGWGLGIESGDYLILPNEGSTTRYQVIEIDYCSDPRDMWFATAVFAPRQQEGNG